MICGHTIFGVLEAALSAPFWTLRGSWDRKAAVCQSGLSSGKRMWVSRAPCSRAKQACVKRLLRLIPERRPAKLRAMPIRSVTWQHMTFHYPQCEEDEISKWSPQAWPGRSEKVFIWLSRCALSKHCRIEKTAEAHSTTERQDWGRARTCQE